ncbi:MAG TPA: GAF domain-containing protein [Terriglobales bacterium]|nr:GAF domain-containing protein [Terriglobales bacterium]
MDRSTLRLPDPNSVPPNGDRRRAVRQKLHTPVYASFNGSDTGLVVDLSELLDLNESGFAVQTSERLEPNRAVSLCLDLPETRNFIHGNGQVIWSDDSGRSGIQFSALSDASRKILKEWLFANLLIAASNHAARTEQLARHHEQEIGSTELETAATLATAAQRSSALSSLDEVRVQIRELGDNSEAIFQFITEAAWELTGASGAALGLRGQGQRQGLEEDQMMWRAATGAPVPPLGAGVDTEHGLSGECVRGGQLVSCDDMENDPRIDPEIGRALGIGSLMASPIVSNFRVVGVLEIFSPHPHAFTKAHGTLLDRLGELVPKSIRETAQPVAIEPEAIEPENIQPSAMDLIHSMEPVFEARSEPVSKSLAEVLEVKAAPEPVAAMHAVIVPEAIAETMAPEAMVPEAISGIPASHTGQAIRAALLDKAPIVVEPAVGKEVSPRDLKSAGSRDSDVAAKQIVVKPIDVKQTIAAAAAAVPVKAKAAAASSSRILHRALIGLAIFVVAIAVGDLIAPLIKKHWPEPSQTAQASSVKTTVNAAEGSSSSSQPVFLKSASDRVSEHVSDHGAADRGTVEQHPPARSIADLQTLANQGDADAQWQLGLRYHNGEGVAQSDSQAMLWFQMAAEQGHVTAQSALGAYYWVGRGVPRDLSKSYFWSEIAMAQGDDISKSRLEGLSSQMTQAQVSAARQQAEVWIRNHGQRAKSEAN